MKQLLDKSYTQTNQEYKIEMNFFLGGGHLGETGGTSPQSTLDPL